MVTKWGFADKLGPLKYEDESQQMMMSPTQNFSEKTAQVIDEEIRYLADYNYTRARKILKDNIHILHNMAEALMHFETINKKQIDLIMAGKKMVDLGVVAQT